MDKYNPPTSFGVFKPVGHIVMAFREDAECREAEKALVAGGFGPIDLVHYSPAEMQSLAGKSISGAGFLASFGYELTLVESDLALATQGCSFLVVHATSPSRVDDVVAIARVWHSVSTQRYGRLVVEDLLNTDVSVQAHLPFEPTPEEQLPRSV